jgi:hypothetical protein
MMRLMKHLLPDPGGTPLGKLMLAFQISQKNSFTLTGATASLGKKKLHTSKPNNVNCNKGNAAQKT